MRGRTARTVQSCSAEMEVRNYNGDAEWSAKEIISRYRQYCAEMEVATPLDVKVLKHSNGAVTWVWPVMEQIIAGIEIGDKACIAIGIEFIQSDHRFAFGRILKANTARALRRTPTPLSDEQRERIRERVARMLVAGNTPREFREYRKLFGRIGVGGWWPYIDRNMDKTDKYALRHYELLQRSAALR